MSYYVSRSFEAPFAEVVERTRKALLAAGFGVVTEIDMAATLKAKLGVDFRPYLILGACNPSMAREALLIEDKVGTMLPCNVVIQAAPDASNVEVAAIDPVASMSAIDNPVLLGLAQIVADKLKEMIAAI